MTKRKRSRWVVQYSHKEVTRPIEEKKKGNGFMQIWSPFQDRRWLLPWKQTSLTRKLLMTTIPRYVDPPSCPQGKKKSWVAAAKANERAYTDYSRPWDYDERSNGPLLTSIPSRSTTKRLFGTGPCTFLLHTHTHDTVLECTVHY